MKENRFEKKLKHEFNIDRNNGRKLEDYSPGSKKKVWWKCSKGHEWEASISNRVNGSNCPYCANRKVCEDNNLAVLFPYIAKQWHPTKNGELTPDKVLPGSTKRAYWVCDAGHIWESEIRNRVRGRGCPYCAGKRVIKGETDLATLNPRLALEWHPTKNGRLKPEDVTAKSGKKIWWKCEKGHEWEAIIYSRHRTGCGCPYCSGKRVMKGETDLATLYPRLALEWHPTKNGRLKPEDVTAKSRKKVWWRCEKGHEWEAIIYSRHISGCPYCFGWQPLK